MAALLMLASLYFLLMVETTAHSPGLEVSLDRTVPQREEGKPCSQFMCLVHGNSAAINTVTISKVKVNEDPSEILAVSASDPEININDEDIRANGTLQGNSAAIYIELIDPSSCVSDFIACEVTFTNRSGHSEESIAIAGPGNLSKLQAVPMTDTEVQDTMSQVEALPRQFYYPYVSELRFLGDKMIRNERYFETRSDRLDKKLSENIETVQRRANTLEDSVLERVSSVETSLASRISRLEDRFSYNLLSESSETSSDVAQTLAHMERRLNDVTATLEQVNASNVASPDDGNHDAQPVVCERGMGDDVTKTFPRYVITTDKTIQRQVLCETQKDGGGWIVIQRRAAGDVDFYRDWTAYRDGFGSLTGDFWLGNEAIHTLTDAHPYELRIDVRINGQELFAEYTSFRIEDESDKYRLRLGTYSGTIGGSSAGLTYSNNQQFSTFDRDNDRNSGHCAIRHHGAWWYNSCHHSNLNSIWLDKSVNGVCWYDGSSWKYPDYTEMKVRKIRPSTSS